MNSKHTKLIQLLPTEEMHIISSQHIGKKTPIWKYWKEFVEERILLGRSLKAICSIRDSLRYIIRGKDVYTIESINNAKTVKLALLGLMKERKTSTTTYNTHIKNIRSYTKWLEANEYIESNNLTKVPKAKETRGERPFLSKEQITLVIGHIQTRKERFAVVRARNIAFVQILRITGVRPCELLSLSSADVNEKKGQYTIKIKGAKQKDDMRIYPIKDKAVEHSLRAYILEKDRVRPNEPMFFLSMSSKHGWTQKGMQRYFQKISKELGFRIVAYAFRRFVTTTLWLSKEMSPRQVMDYMGHSKLSTTLRYVEEGPERTLQAANIMAKLRLDTNTA